MKKVIALMLIILILLMQGCKKSNINSEEVKADDFIPDLNMVSQDDSIDPENTESGISDGAEVYVRDLYHESGKANGIDVSKWQGKINWQAVAADGIDFAVIRIGYRAENGTIYRDANADYNIQQATAAGLLVGVYFFSTAVNIQEAYEEAVWTVNAVAGYKISYPIVYDCEGFLNSSSRMKNLSASERTDNAIKFLNTVTENGYEGMFYAAKNDLSRADIWETDRIETNFKIWLAQYTVPPYPQTAVPDYNGKYDMWQYTNKGTVNGIDGNCDLILSYFVNSEKGAKDESKTPDAATPPKTQDELIYTATDDYVTAKEIVNLREGAGTNYNIAGKLQSGDFLHRIATGTNGWSKLIFGGKTVYAITSYLTTEVIKVPEKDIVNGAEFTAVYDSVTAKQEVNLRAMPSSDSEILGTLKNGTFLNRTATGTNGWSRLIFEGKTVYAVTSYLTTKADEAHGNEAPELEQTTEYGMVFKPKAGKVTAKEETNLRNKPTTENSDIVYTLKNGEYAEKTAESSSGWSKLKYNGKTVYAITSYLCE